ncbi:MAG: group II intron reverse transcriptase/maturase [Proteobacteria bacterium]|nr:group II intron reverse transcriptase/maturase [Pseudomonadota bacterium]
MPMEQRKSHRANLFKLAPEPCSHGPFRGYVSLDRINSAARRDPEKKFKALLQQFTVENLRQAFRSLDGSKAVGIDQVTKDHYAQNLDENLQQLAGQIARGGWRPRPSREVLIPKADGGKRPLAIGCLEDKIVQQLGAKILEAIYESSFHLHSYGFRPKRNTHQALARLYKVIQERSENCVIVEMDLEKFFNSMSHEKLLEILTERIEDHHFLRLIRRILRNSILSEEGEIRQNEQGAPQGAPISPMLANIYLHACLDTWFEENWAVHAQMVRYADDAVFVFTDLRQAQEFKASLAQRFHDYILKMNDEKSGILSFSQQAPEAEIQFLGFHFYWGRKSKNSSKKLLKVKTSPKKLGRSIEAYGDWIKKQRSRVPLEKLWEQTAQKLRGHYSYYGLIFNRSKLSYFYYAIVGILFKWLNRRSQKRSYTWDGFAKRLKFKPLPKPSKAALIDITSGLVPELKRNMKSRMRKLRTYGSERSPGLSPVFT